MKNTKHTRDDRAERDDAYNEELQWTTHGGRSLLQDADGGSSGQCTRANSAEEGRPDTGAPCADGACVLSGFMDSGMTYQYSIGLPR